MISPQLKLESAISGNLEFSDDTKLVVDIIDPAIEQFQAAILHMSTTG